MRSASTAAATRSSHASGAAGEEPNHRHDSLPKPLGHPAGDGRSRDRGVRADAVDHPARPIMGCKKYIVPTEVPSRDIASGQPDHARVARHHARRGLLHRGGGNRREASRRCELRWPRVARRASASPSICNGCATARFGPTPRRRSSFDTDTIAIVDGNRGFGQVIGEYATRIGTPRPRRRESR